MKTEAIQTIGVIITMIEFVNEFLTNGNPDIILDNTTLAYISTILTCFCISAILWLCVKFSRR